MRTEIRVLLFSGLFVGGIAAIYWFTSYEDAGTTMLALAAVAYSMLCGYLYLQTRNAGAGAGSGSDAAPGGGSGAASGGARPSDLEEAAVPDSGETEVGYFPAASVWPPALAMGAVLTALGLVFGYWFLVIAAIFFVGAIVGYAVEAQTSH